MWLHAALAESDLLYQYWGWLQVT